MLEAHKETSLAPMSLAFARHGAHLPPVYGCAAHNKTDFHHHPRAAAAADDVPRLQRTAFEYARAISAGHGRARAGAGVIGRRRRNMGAGRRQGR